MAHRRPIPSGISLIELIELEVAAVLGADRHDPVRSGLAITATVCSFLRTVVMNLLRRGGYRSICQSLRELAYDIKVFLVLGSVATTWLSTA